MQEENAKKEKEIIKLPTKPSDLAVIPDYVAPLATEEENRVNTPPEKQPESEPELANKITQPIKKTNNDNNTSKDTTTTATELVEDEFQDEIQFDPTISSGQLGFKEGDFRNTPIKLGDRSESVQPTTPVPFPVQPEVATIEAMSPTEAEVLLSSKIAEKNVITDEQAQEVSALLTPDKDLPPVPIDALRYVTIESRKNVLIQAIMTFKE